MPRTYTGRQTRQGDIVLRKPWQRALFIAGLSAGFVALLIVAVLFHFGAL